MEPPSVSLTVTFEVQRSYIKIKTLGSKNLIEIHSALSEHWTIVQILVGLIVFVKVM